MKKTSVLIIIIFLLAIGVRLICFVGLIGSDDLNYNRNAYNISTGTFTPSPNHQDTRLGLFLPVAATFSLFGVNEISSIAFPFLCFLITFILIVSTAIRYFGYWTGILAGLLYAFLPIEIFHATMLLTDLPCSTFLYSAPQKLDRMLRCKIFCLDYHKRRGKYGKHSKKTFRSV